MTDRLALTVPVIAALYVEGPPRGVYCGLPDVEVWDESRDARLYAGPWPVVAHPPCQRWGAFAPINFRRWGGEHNRPGNDGGCFESALASVRRWCGVLEHPAASRAWARHGLPKPSAGWSLAIGDGGWVCEVSQAAYGHLARKLTWLYYVGEAPPPPLDWRSVSGTHQCGYHDQRGKERNKPTLSKAEASRTPPAFRDVLIAMARSAGKERAP